MKKESKKDGKRNEKGKKKHTSEKTEGEQRTFFDYLLLYKRTHAHKSFYSNLVRIWA
jgi:hypothetical protein